jgi:hypothetical protein
LVGTNVYPAFNTQTVIANNKPQPRDREAVYVWGVNGEQLGPGYYLCRLVNSYAGLPLMVTYCCVTSGTTSGSSSSSSSAKPAPVSCGVSRVSLGVAATGTGTTLTIPAVSIDRDSRLIAVAYVAGRVVTPTVTYGADALTADASSLMPAGPPPGLVTIFSLPVGPGTADLTLTITGAAEALALQAVQVLGLGTAGFGTVDKAINNASGTVPPVDTGSTGPLSAPCEYAQAAFMVATIFLFNWANGFSSGGQDAGLLSGTTALTCSEGWKAVTAPADADLTVVNTSGWCGCLVTYF